MGGTLRKTVGALKEARLLANDWEIVNENI